MRARALVLVIVLIVAAASPSPAAGQSATPSFEADIATLMEVTGSARMADQIVAIMAGQLTDSLRARQPDVPPRAFEIINEVVLSVSADAFHGPEGLLAKMVPLYMKYFSHDEVLGLIAFYRSDLGKKTVTAMPALMQESALLGQTLQPTLGPAIQKELERRFRAEGFIK